MQQQVVAIILYNGFIDDGTNEGIAVFLCCLLSSYDDGKKF
jgi:hypothetical protein